MMIAQMDAQMIAQMDTQMDARMDADRLTSPDEPRETVGTAPVAAAGATLASEVSEGPGMARRVAGNSIWLIGQPLLLNVLSIASTAYISRKLGADGYGIFNLGLAEATLFAPICNLGLRAVMVRKISSDRDQAEHATAVFGMLRLLTCCFATLLALVWLLRPGVDLPVRLVGMAVVVCVILTGAGQVAVDLAQGYERSRLGAQPQLVGGIVLTVCSVLALVLGWGLPGFVAAYVLGAALQFVLLVRMVRRNFFPPRVHWDLPQMRAYAMEARPFALKSVIGTNTQPGVLDVVILGMFATQGTVGAYAAAIGLVSRLLIIPLGVGDALYPAIAGSIGKDTAATQREARRVLTLLLLVTLPVAVGIGMTAPTVLNILFGREYVSAAPAMQIAVLLLPLNGLSYALNECLSAAHRQNDVAKLTVAGGALLLVLFAVFIPIMGILGAALALVARDALMLPFRLRVFRVVLGQPLRRSDLFRLAVASGLMAIPLALAPGISNTPATVGVGLLSLAVYGSVAILLGLVPGVRLPRSGAGTAAASPAG